MDRISTLTKVLDLFGIGKPGFRDGDLATGVVSTDLNAAWFNGVQEELLAIIEAAGIAPSAATYTQVAKALQAGKLWSAAAVGTADAITATYNPGVTALTNGMTLNVRATAANTTAAPTFTPASGTIAAKTIVKGAGAALVAGDIAGGGHWVELQYDSTLDKWVLRNPALGVSVLTQAVGDARYATQTGFQQNSYSVAAAAGTADAITATYSPAIAALTNGMTLNVRATAANTTAAPTFTPASGTIAAKTIVKGASAALVAGDIAGGGHWVELQYDLTLDKWVLLNPASGAMTRGYQIFTASGSFTVPAGVNRVRVRLVGGGGAGGGGSATTVGAGGGAGGYAEGNFSVTPGQVVAVTIGAGGVGSVNAAGAAGGTTSFGAFASGTGGGGGPSATPGSAGGGAPGGGSGSGCFVTTGGFGGDGANSNGCSGGASAFGGGARGSTSSGVNASAYGSGGGGIYSASSNWAGGAGAAGVVIVEY
jgi:hypothetical protein